MKLNKKICKKCLPELGFGNWGRKGERNWKEGLVFCPLYSSHYGDDETVKGFEVFMRPICNGLTGSCVYNMEQTVMSQNEVEKC